MCAEDPPLEWKSFEYDKLPSHTSIRLLTTFKQSKQPGPPQQICGVPIIKCRLRTVALHEAPDYNALSYTWGNPFQSKHSDNDDYAVSNKWPIAVNGRLLFVTKNLYEALSELREPKIDRRCQPYNKTRLIEAAENGELSQVESWLQQGADVDATDCFGETALHYAAENGHIEVVRCLLSHGADPELLDASGRTSLVCALEQKRRAWSEVVTLLQARSSRQKDKVMAFKEKERIFWIDAICINQEDVTERNTQIAMMAQIFAAAKSVVVWLGVLDDMADAACQLLTYLQREFPNGGVLLGPDDLFKIFSLLRRSYFKRTWVIQEITLAQHIEVYCGHYELDWTALFQHMPINIPLDAKLKFTDEDVINWDKWNIGSIAWILMDIRNARKNTAMDAHPMLPVLLALTWPFIVSDPRDKIYALLGIVGRQADVADVSADYRKSVTDVFIEVGKIFIQAIGSNKFSTKLGKTLHLQPLEGLSFVQAPIWCASDQCPLRPQRSLFPSSERPPGLPSWAPVFHWRLTTERLFFRDFHAAGSRPVHFYPSEERVLKLDGLMVDEIVETEKKLHETAVGSPPNVIIYSILEVASHIEQFYPTGISPVEALWRTLAANRVRTRGELDKYAKDVIVESFKYFLCGKLYTAVRDGDKQMLDVLDTLRASDSSNLLPTTAEIEKYEHSDHIAVAVDSESEKKLCFQVAFERFMPNRRLARTRDGYLALCPRAARDGDQIWLFGGGCTPFLLRPIPGSNQFSFLGETYVHGIMKGEKAERTGVVFQPVELV